MMEEKKSYPMETNEPKGQPNFEEILNNIQDQNSDIAFEAKRQTEELAKLNNQMQRIADALDRIAYSLSRGHQ